jgi:hypothetical protein
MCSSIEKQADPYRRIKREVSRDFRLRYAHGETIRNLLVESIEL